MAITRIWQSGWEIGSVVEAPNAIIRTTQGTISNTKAYTDTYSLRFGGGTSAFYSYGVLFPSTTQIVANCFLNHNGIANQLNSGNAIIFQWTTNDGNDNFVRVSESLDVELVINGSIEDTITFAAAGISTVDTWYMLGLHLFTDASTGWVSFYVNGTEILSASALNTGTGVTEFYFGGGDAVYGVWDAYAYFDDCYVSDAVGEGNDAPAEHRFLWFGPTADAGTDWGGSDGDSIDNYQLVDETPPDDDTTYVYALAAGSQDLYDVADLTLPLGYDITAAIPTAIARRASITEKIKLQAYDGGDTTDGSEQNLGVDYAVLYEFMDFQPDLSEWNETDFNNMQFGFESAGTF